MAQARPSLWGHTLICCPRSSSSGSAIAGNSRWPDAACLFALDVGGLENRPPLVDLGLEEFCQALRRLLLAGRNVEPKLGQARAYRRIGQRFDHRTIEFADHLIGRALRRIQS